VALFGGGWFLPFGLGYFDAMVALKLIYVVTLILAIRAASPRLRLDSLLQLSWTHYLPLSVSLLPFYLWVGYITGTLRPSEYRLFKNSGRIVERFGYDTWRRLWAQKTTETDLRIDTSLAGFAFPIAPTKGGEYFMTSNTKLNSPS